MAAPHMRKRGALEREILTLLRAHGPNMSARQLQETFDHNPPAYTTLMTVLTRLEKKGLVVRTEHSPRKVTFRPAHSEQEHASESMIAALEQVADREAALLAFAGRLDEQDLDLLTSTFTNTRKGGNAP